MEEIVTINVPLDVPQQIIDSKLVNLYATDKGWDGQGDPIEFLTGYIRKMVKADFERSYSSYLAAQAALKAEADAKAFFQ